MPAKLNGVRRHLGRERGPCLIRDPNLLSLGGWNDVISIYLSHSLIVYPSMSNSVSNKFTQEDPLVHIHKATTTLGTLPLATIVTWDHCCTTTACIQASGVEGVSTTLQTGRRLKYHRYTVKRLHLIHSFIHSLHFLVLGGHTAHKT